MKKRIILVLSICVIGTFTACSSLDNYLASTEESIIDTEDAEQSEPVEETADEGSGTPESVNEPEDEFHIEQSEYSPLMVLFSQLNPDITFEEIEEYTSENELFCDRKDYTGNVYEVRVASDSNVAEIGRYREKGENVFFIYNADDTLAYAEYSDDAGLEILFFGHGYGISDPRDMKAMGWGDEDKVTGKWYYNGDGVIETDTPEMAIDGAFKE